MGSVNLFESHTARFWAVIVAVAIGVLFAASMLEHFGVHVLYVSDLFQLLGLGGGAQTARNITADHVVPMIQARQNPGAPPGGQVLE